MTQSLFMLGARWLAALLLVSTLSACTTTKPAKDDKSIKAPVAEVRPGAERWEKHALELPAGSPVVFWAKSDVLLEGVAGLRDWLFAQPAMFGSDGALMVAQVKQEWRSAIASLGMDPLEAESWQELGLDTSREFYLGAYPVADGSKNSYVSAFETALRGALELDKEAKLEPAFDTLALLASGDVPNGVHTRVAEAVGDNTPVLGMRGVLPVADKRAFMDSVDKLMVGAEYTRIDLEPDKGEEGGDDEARTRHLYYALGGDFPGILLRMSEDLAVVDLMSRGANGEAAGGEATSEDRSPVDALKKRVLEVVARVDSGRPAAPRLPGAPLMGIAVDQEGAGRYARLRGYELALEAAQVAAVAERDVVFVGAVHDALRSAGNWAVASGSLSGVSYGLFSGEKTGGFFRLNITLFGARGDKDLAISPAPMGLAVDRRGLGMSVDLAPIREAGWQSFIGVSDPEHVVDYFAAAEFDPAFFALSFPRSVAVLFANSDKIFEQRMTDFSQPLLEGKEVLERLELASAGIDMRALRARPRLVGLLTLDADSEPDERSDLAEAMARALSKSVAQVADAADAKSSKDEQGEEPGKDTTNVALAADKLVDLGAEGGSPAYLFYNSAPERPWVYFSYGLDRAASQEELDALEAAGGGKSKGGIRQGPHTFYARGEPVALLSLATLFEPNLFDPLDVSILAQRLGALVFSVRPEVIDGVQTIRYDLELRKPPSLD